MIRNFKIATGGQWAAVLAGALAISCASSCGADHPLPAKSSPPQKSDTAEKPSGKTASCFDGERALAHVKRLVAIGPRPPASTQLEQARGYIEQTLRSQGAKPERQSFVAYTPHPDFKTVEMANIIVRFGPAPEPAVPPGAGSTVIIGGHFDGKMIPQGAFVGANDGGSSTGVLLEMARCLTANPPATPVTLLFFDGEEALVTWSDSDSLYGSKHYALSLKQEATAGQVAAMVNIDMVGDRDLHLFHEQMSTPWVFAALKGTAEKLGFADIFSGPRGAVADDHEPFLKIGVPAANLIDLDFGANNEYWHTTQDTVDKLSAGSMEKVAKTVLEAIPVLAKGPPKE